MNDDVNTFVFVVTAIFGVLVYLIPSFVAVARKTDVTVAIFLLNLLLGWTFLGWAVALIWAFAAKTENQRHMEAALQAQIAAAITPRKDNQP